MSEQPEEYDYEPIPVTPGDRFLLRISDNFVIGGQQKFVTAEADIHVLPEETADDTAARVQDAAMGLLFDTVDRYREYIQHRNNQ